MTEARKPSGARYRLRRFIRDAAGGLHRHLASHPFPKRLLFVHVPKVGGTALERAIADAFDAGTPRLEDDARLAARFAAELDVELGMVRFHAGSHPPLLAIAAFHMYRGDGYVHGHVPVSRRLLDEFADRYLYMTVLRDPVERWISRYRWDKVRNASPDALPSRAWEGTLEEEIRRFMRSPQGVETGRAYTWFLGGIHAGGDIGSRAAVELAMENLSRFHILGTSEDWEPLVSAFERHFGKRLEIGVENRTADKEREKGVGYDVAAAVTDEIRAEIRSLCAQDIEIYEHCRALVREREGAPT